MFSNRSDVPLLWLLVVQLTVVACWNKSGEKEVVMLKAEHFTCWDGRIMRSPLAYSQRLWLDESSSPNVFLAALDRDILRVLKVILNGFFELHASFSGINLILYA